MANIGFDHFNKYILHDEVDTSITVQEVYDAAKDEEDFPHVGMTTGIILDATGKDPLGGIEFTGITLVLRNGWTFFCRTVPASDITIKLAGGNLIAESPNARFTHVDNVHYEFGQSTSPALIVTAGVLTPTQQQIRDASTLATSEPIIAGSIDNKLDIIDTNVDTSNTSIVTLQSDVTDLLTLEGNTQEWVSPGLLKIYADGQSIGGTTFAEIETRDINGVQTFVIADVRQYIRTK
jgi:hypothetical protein